MHGIAAITGNMHRSLRYFVLLERITSLVNVVVHICLLQVHVCMYVCMYVCVHVYVCMYVCM